MVALIAMRIARSGSAQFYWQAWGYCPLPVAVLLGIGGMKLYQSEMPGPFKEERLTPRLADTARTLWLTYVILDLICTHGLLDCRDQPFFDTLCHGLSTVSRIFHRR